MSKDKSNNIGKKTKSIDILFLERKLIYYISHEEYEKASVIKRWIDELEEKEKKNSN
jgi:protein-arginine kinase activator protein McsA